MATAEAEALDFEPEDDDLMDEDVGDLSPRAAAPMPKLKSAITGGSAPRKTKGRGFREEADAERDARLSSRDFDSLDTDGGPGPLRCEFFGSLLGFWYRVLQSYRLFLVDVLMNAKKVSLICNRILLEALMA